MKRSVPLEYSVLLKFISKLESVNIIVGTGAMARDLRQKLLLMNLQAPFLIGDYCDDEHAIKHYSEIANLNGDKSKYRFILCCGRNEWETLRNAQIAINRFFGIIVRNHPQVITLFNVTADYADTENMVTDAMNSNSIIKDDVPYVVYGDENDKNAFSIHLTGSCMPGGVYTYALPSMPKLLHGLLAKAGFNCVVYAWGQPTSPIGDEIVRLIRDICNFKCDLFVLFYNDDVDALYQPFRNTMPTCAGTLTYRHSFLRRVQNNSKPISNGVSHAVDLMLIRKTQRRIIAALARLYGFDFLNILLPNSGLMLHEHAKAFKGTGSALFARKVKERAELVTALDAKHTLDYTEMFYDTEDIYEIYVDAHHLSGEGNRILAQRLANDILKAFGQKN